MGVGQRGLRSSHMRFLSGLRVLRSVLFFFHRDVTSLFVIFRMVVRFVLTLARGHVEGYVYASSGMDSVVDRQVVSLAMDGAVDRRGVNYHVDL